MDDRTIIDDGSERITDPTAAKPGDLLVLGQMEGDDFKQKAWLTINDVATGRMGFDSVSYSIVKIDFVYPISFIIPSEATRTDYPVSITVGDNDKPIYTPLHFDCLIRPFTPKKRGVYEYDGKRMAYFDGKSQFVFLDDIAHPIAYVEGPRPDLPFDPNLFEFLWSPDDGKPDDNVHVS